MLLAFSFYMPKATHLIRPSKRFPVSARAAQKLTKEAYAFAEHTIGCPPAVPSAVAVNASKREKEIG